MKNNNGCLSQLFAGHFTYLVKWPRNCPADPQRKISPLCSIAALCTFNKNSICLSASCVIRMHVDVPQHQFTPADNPIPPLAAVLRPAKRPLVPAGRGRRCTAGTGGMHKVLQPTLCYKFIFHTPVSSAKILNSDSPAPMWSFMMNRRQ